MKLNLAIVVMSLAFFDPSYGWAQDNSVYSPGTQYDSLQIRDLSIRSSVGEQQLNIALPGAEEFKAATYSLDAAKKLLTYFSASESSVEFFRLPILLSAFESGVFAYAPGMDKISSAKDLYDKFTFTAEDLKLLHENFQTVLSKPQSQVASLKRASALLCNENCAKGIVASLDLMKPSYALNSDEINYIKRYRADVAQLNGIRGVLSMNEQVEKFVDSPESMKCLHQLKHLILDKVQKLKNHGGSAGDLFEDAALAFGSQSKALEFLGIYGTRGANSTPWLGMETGPLYSFAVSMGEIGIGIRMLDVLSFNSNTKIYSLPPSIKTQLSYNRPYHFWMSAYLASELLKKNISPTDALKSVHTLGALYEAFAEVPTNRGANSDYKAGSQYQFESQKDIAFNDAGAAWACSADTYIVNVDNGLLAMVNASREPNIISSALAYSLIPLSQASGIDFQNYPKWLTRVQPDESLKYFTSSL